MNRRQAISRAAAIATAVMFLGGCASKPIFRTPPDMTTATERTPVAISDSASVLSPPVISPADSLGVSDARAAQLEEIAQSWVGTPYRRGREDAKGTDCSGLTQSVLSELGVSLPRSTHEQLQTGHAVPVAELAPGDLLFFRMRGSSRVNHVGVSLGTDRFLHASSSRGVVVDHLDSYFSHRLVEARRVVDGS